MVVWSDLDVFEASSWSGSAAMEMGRTSKRSSIGNIIEVKEIAKETIGKLLLMMIVDRICLFNTHKAVEGVELLRRHNARWWWWWGGVTVKPRHKSVRVGHGILWAMLKMPPHFSFGSLNFERSRNQRAV